MLLVNVTTTVLNRLSIHILLAFVEVVSRYDEDAVLVTRDSGDNLQDQSDMHTLCFRCDSTDRLELC